MAVLYLRDRRVYPKASGLAAWSETANGTALCH